MQYAIGHMLLNGLLESGISGGAEFFSLMRCPPIPSRFPRFPQISLGVQISPMPMFLDLLLPSLRSCKCITTEAAKILEIRSVTKTLEAYDSWYN